MIRAVVAQCGNSDRVSGRRVTAERTERSTVSMIVILPNGNETGKNRDIIQSINRDTCYVDIPICGNESHLFDLRIHKRGETRQLLPVADKESIEDRNFALWAADVEFSQRVGAGKFLTLDVFRTTRAPTIEELYNQGPHLAAYTYERGYHKLDAESGYGAELEYRDYGEVLCWRASAHGTWFLNHLAPRATGDTNWSQLLPVYRVRGDEALLVGASGTVETVAEQGLRASGSASYVRGVFRDRDWGDMPQIPPFKFHGELGYLWPHVSPSVYADFALAQNFVDRYEETTPGYVTFGAILEIRWTLALAHYSLVFRADNLLDEDIRNHLSRLKSVMPEKGRSFSVLAKAEF